MTAQERQEHRRAEYDRGRADDPHRKLYGTREWAMLRRRLYAERGGVCQECGRLTVLHRREACEIGQVAEFHHLKAVRQRPDLALDPSNIELLCHDCHSRHTAKEQGFARAR